MNSARGKNEPVVGTIEAPRYVEFPITSGADRDGDVFIHGRLFTYETDDGLVAGDSINIMFSIDRPARDIWRHFKDFNLWQKGHFYSGIIGDLEGKTYAISAKPNDSSAINDRQVIKVIPEHLIITMGLLPKDGSKWVILPGLGGNVSPGFNVFMLSEHGGKTVVTIYMQHASYASRTHDMPIEEALRPWREILHQGCKKWREDFIPDLKRLVCGK